MEVPLSTTLLVTFAPRLLPRSEEEPDTELLTAAKTTLANEMPEVEPRYRGSLAPWTETMPMLDTSLVSFSRSYLSLSSRACAVVGLVVPLRGGGGGTAVAEAAATAAAASAAGLDKTEPLDAKAGLKSSASWKATSCSCSSVSRYATRVSR